MVPHVGGNGLPQPDSLTQDYLEQYSGLGIRCTPLCCPNALGKCGCGWDHKPKESGKAPRTSNGTKDATADLTSLKTMWQSFPAGNIGIVLEPSQLLIIGPDAPKWLAKFQHRGLPDTPWVQTGSGEGHRHYYYRRPVDCPIWRINRPGEYDIQTGGYAVAPPSLHHSGNRYTWQQPLPASFSDIPYAPQWAVDMLIEAADKKKQVNLLAADVGGSETPLLPDVYGMKWWNGELVARNPDNGEIDRSGTLYSIGIQLARGGTSLAGIAQALLERDAALGFGKYSDRNDDREYLRIAEKVVADRLAHPLRPANPGPLARIPE